MMFCGRVDRVWKKNINIFVLFILQMAVFNKIIWEQRDIITKKQQCDIYRIVFVVYLTRAKVRNLTRGMSAGVQKCIKKFNL